MFPFAEGRQTFRAAGDASRSHGLAKVIRGAEEAAVVLLSGVPLLPNSGDATIIGMGFSGLYEARPTRGDWRLTRRIPIEETGEIRGHRMNVSLRPGEGLTVEDRMTVRVKGTNGFAVRLNHAARVEEIRLQGRKAPHEFAGGLLWIDLPEGDAEIVVRYTLKVESGIKPANSGQFLDSFGHLRSQYFWHPFFGFGTAGDWAHFEIQVRLPRDFRLTTSLPQSERLEGAERVVEGRTVQPTSALSLIYDRDWNVARKEFTGLRIELFTAPDVDQEQETLANAAWSAYNALSKRFGTLPAGYLGVVQARSWNDQVAGWRFATNQVIVGAKKPGPSPAHEIAHLWTFGAGAAQHLLQEGWAAWVESLMLETNGSPEAVRAFWTLQEQVYMFTYDGKTSLIDDPYNQGIAYSKGPWVFRMLERALGRERFEKTMREYSRRSRMTPAGWEVLAEAAQQAASPDFDVRLFLKPWVEGKSAPRISAQVTGRKVTLMQDGAFILPLVIEASAAGSVHRKQVWLKGREASVEFPTEPADVKIDPDRELLLRR